MGNKGTIVLCGVEQNGTVLFMHINLKI